MKISVERTVLFQPENGYGRGNSFRTARHAANFWAQEKAHKWAEMHQYNPRWSIWDDRMAEIERRRKVLVRRSLHIFRQMLEG